MWAGLEVAAYVHDKAHSVAVVGTSKVALQHVFGSKIGARIAQVACKLCPYHIGSVYVRITQVACMSVSHR